MQTNEVGDPAMLVPRLTLGETAQGLLTAAIQPAKTVTRPFSSERINAIALKKEIQWVF